MVATKEWGRDLLTPDELLDRLEEIRAAVGATTPRSGKAQTIEGIAAGKRKFHLGGDGNHRFEGERYLGITDNKEVRRFQLRKLIDEGGQNSVGGPLPSHPTLQRWHSVEFGLSEEEIHRLEMEDALPERLL